MIDAQAAARRRGAVHAQPVTTLDTLSAKLVRERSGYAREVDDSGLRRVQRRHSRGVRLDLAQLLWPEPPQAGHAVGQPAPLELVEPVELGLVERDDQLSAALERNPVPSQNSYSSRAPSTHSRAFSEPGA